MHRRATTVLLALVIAGATACGSTTDTLDSVDELPSMPSEPDDVAAETAPDTVVPDAPQSTETAAPQSTETVAPESTETVAPTPSSAVGDSATPDDTTPEDTQPPDTTPSDDTTSSDTTPDGTAITQLSPQAVPSLDPDASQPARPASNEFPLDPNSTPVQAAVADLAARLGVPLTDVTIVDALAVTWGDSSLGCPQPGMQYLQRITDGSLVVLNVGGTDYRYTGGTPLTLCE